MLKINEWMNEWVCGHAKVLCALSSTCFPFSPSLLHSWWTKLHSYCFTHTHTRGWARRGDVKHVVSSVCLRHEWLQKMAVSRHLETVKRVSCRVGIDMKRPEAMPAKNQGDTKANRPWVWAQRYFLALHGPVLVLSIERQGRESPVGHYGSLKWFYLCNIPVADEWAQCTPGEEEYENQFGRKFYHTKR